MFLTAPAPHTEAAAAIRGKTPMTRKVFDGLLPELQETAFVVSGVECFDTLQRIQETIATLPEGGQWEDIKAKIEEELEAHLDNDAARERRAELLLRLHGFRAYAATNFRLMEAHRDDFPYRQYISTGDGRVRESHAKLHGKIFPATSPFWDNHTPPWAWGCRCEAVPILADEADEMRGEDAGKPPEEQRVLPEFLLERAETLGEIHVGNGQVISVQTDREKTGEPGALEWRPGDIGMPLDKIRARYDDTTWTAWQGWAEKARLPDGRTLWAALNTKSKSGRAPKKTAKAEPPAAPAPLPAAATVTAIIPSGGAPVTAIFPPGLPKELKQAGAAVDAVHGDGALVKATIKAKAGTSGSYAPWTGDIKFGKESKTRPLQLVHELGHKLDMEALPGKGYSSLHQPKMAPVIEAIKASRAYQDIAAEGAALGSPQHYITYLQSTVELWARAYSQFIAEESGDPRLLSDLASRRTGQDYFKSSQWDTADFAPVRKAIRVLFTDLGWMTPATRNPLPSPTP
ncbi:MAG: phage minor head protein [Verrucomicrobiota bacterium]